MLFLWGWLVIDIAAELLGNADVECDKTSSFGNCEGHYWQCGGGGGGGGGGCLAGIDNF